MCKEIKKIKHSVSSLGGWRTASGAEWVFRLLFSALHPKMSLSRRSQLLPKEEGAKQSQHSQGRHLSSSPQPCAGWGRRAGQPRDGSHVQLGVLVIRQDQADLQVQDQAGSASQDQVWWWLPWRDGAQKSPGRFRLEYQPTGGRADPGSPWLSTGTPWTQPKILPA